MSTQLYYTAICFDVVDSCTYAITWHCILQIDV